MTGTVGEEVPIGHTLGAHDGIGALPTVANVVAASDAD
jgi:hypothetical protein